MKKILIVDDEPQIALLLNSRLKANHYEVYAAQDPIQGLSMAMTKLPDVILLDIRMPAGGGTTLFSNLRSHIQTALIPVIFITAYPNEEIKEACLANGAAGFIAKPFKPDEVLRTVRRVLGEEDPSAAAQDAAAR